MLQQEYDYDVYEKILDKVLTLNLLNKDGLIILEHHNLKFKNTYNNLTLYKEKRYGNKSVNIYLKSDVEDKEVIASSASFDTLRTVTNGSINTSTKKSSTQLDKKNSASDSYEIHIPQNESFSAIFIPSKDMLTHSKGLLAMSEKYNGFPFDKTLTDIINRASQWKLKKIPTMAKSFMPVLERMIDGEVTIENEEFFIKKNNGQLINFAVEAEGLKKIGLLWQLIMNENITEDSILIWDEPEANLNPEFFPNLVECLLELSRYNVQICVSTHNYIFAKYFDVRRKETDAVKFHSLYKDFENNIQIESKRQFHELNHNDIMTAFEKLLNEVYNLK